MQGLEEGRIGHKFSGAGVIGNCEPPPLELLQELLPAESSSQLHKH